MSPLGTYHESHTHNLYRTLANELYQITDDQGAPFESNGIFHDFLVLVLISCSRGIGGGDARQRELTVTVTEEDSYGSYLLLAVSVSLRVFERIYSQFRKGILLK